MIKFFISGNVPSSKNSKMITRSKMIINSPTVQKYLKTYGEQWKDEELIQKFHSQIKGYPIKLHMQFTRDSKRRADYVNIAQYPLDLMVKNGWIPDDDYSHVIPVFEDVIIDKDNAGIEFWVENI